MINACNEGEKPQINKSVSQGTDIEEQSPVSKRKKSAKNKTKNKWNKDNRKDQQNQVLWKDKIDKLLDKKMRINHKWKRRHYNWYKGSQKTTNSYMETF